MREQLLAMESALQPHWAVMQAVRQVMVEQKHMLEELPR